MFVWLQRAHHRSQERCFPVRQLLGIMWFAGWLSLVWLKKVNIDELSRRFCKRSAESYYLNAEYVLLSI